MPDHPDAAGQSDPVWPGLRLTRTIDEATVTALRGIARASRATLFMTLLTAFEMMLVRRLDRRDLAIGLPGANRSGQARRMPWAAFRTRSRCARIRRPGIAGDPGFAEVLDAVRAASVTAFEHQHVPLDLVLAALPRRRGFGLAQTMPVLFQLQNYPHAEPLEAGGALIEPFRFDSGIAQADLSVEIGQHGDRLECDFSVRRSALAGGRGRRHDRALSRVAARGGAEPGHAAERDRRVMSGRSVPGSRQASRLSNARKYEIATGLVIVGLALGHLRRR